MKTVGQMMDGHWAARARCQKCHTLIIVHLFHIVRGHGRDFSLWDFHPRCWCMQGKFQCSGRVTFQARPHPAMDWTDLVAQSLMPGSLSRPAVQIDPIDGRPVPPPPDYAR